MEFEILLLCSHKSTARYRRKPNQRNPRPPILSL